MKKIIIILVLSPFLLSFGSKKKDSSSAPQYEKDYNAGVEAQKNQNYSSAISYYQSALNQKSDFPDAWNNLGYCYRMIAKSYLMQAGEAYDKAIQYDPSHEGALEYQGQYFVMTGQLKKAYSNYKKLQQMDSDKTEELKEKLDKVLVEARSVLKEYSP